MQIVIAAIYFYEFLLPFVRQILVTFIKNVYGNFQTGSTDHLAICSVRSYNILYFN
jgi:hypothetical protein